MRWMRPVSNRLAMGRVSRKKRSACESSANAFPLNCRLSRNSLRSRPRKRATRSRHCGISNSRRSALPNNTAAARNRTPSRSSPSPRSKSSGSRLPGSFSRPIRTASATVLRTSATSRSSTVHPLAGWFSQRCSLCIRSKSILVVLLGGHGHGRVADPAISGTPVLAGPSGALVYADRDHLEREAIEVLEQFKDHLASFGGI